MNEWLKDLKVGDEVAYCWGRYPILKRIEKVERITATQIIVGREKFWRKNGQGVGRSTALYSRFLLQLTPALRAELRREQIALALKHFDWSKLPLSMLEPVWEITQQYKAAEQLKECAGCGSAE